MSEKNCSTCIIYGYHVNLPERIESDRQKKWDEVLTKACNLCDCFSNWHDANKYKLNDLFVQELALKLRSEEVLAYGRARSNRKSKQ